MTGLVLKSTVVLVFQNSISKFFIERSARQVLYEPYSPRFWFCRGMFGFDLKLEIQRGRLGRVSAIHKISCVKSVKTIIQNSYAAY
jgi:hypothetical protein